MTLRHSVYLAATAVLALSAIGCGRDNSQKPAPPNTDPIVFDDAFGNRATFQAFAGSKVDAVTLDTVEKFSGTTSLKISVPGPGDVTGTYAGGAFTTDLDRELTGYNALTFQVKSSIATTLDVAGLGNDNTGTSKFEAKISVIPVTTGWTKVVIPIPDASKLGSEQGLFFFAEGIKNGAPHTIWFDDVKFENLLTISNPRPALAPKTVDSFVGATVVLDGTTTVFNVNGMDQTVAHMAGYFAFASTNTSVAAVTNGALNVVGPGSTVITAKLGTVNATGEVTLNASTPPTVAAPTPTAPAAKVVSLFSNAYTNVGVDTWSATWDIATVADIRIAGNDTKIYTDLTYAGIEFTTQTVNATAMTHLHLDIWAPAGGTFKVKLVDFGEDGLFGGAPDSEHELTFTASSNPPFTTGAWVGLEIPLDNFRNLTARGHLAQMILAGDARTFYLDNVYFVQSDVVIPPNTDPTIFTDDFTSGVAFQAFDGSKTDAVSIDTAEHHAGTASIKISVPASGSYAGGAFTADVARQLTANNALTFWAKSSIVTTLDVAGLGNDNTGTSKYEAKRTAVALTTEWTKIVIPVPDASRLTAEQGLIFFAQGPKGGAPHTLWFDDVKFENLATITNPRPVLATKTVDTVLGANVALDGTTTVFSVDGTDRTVEHMAGYFTFTSSNTAVATVTNAIAHVVGSGSTNITGRLGAINATGSVTLNVIAPPTVAAPTPVVPAGNVIALFSNAYPNAAVDTWSAGWDQATVADLKIANNDTKLYTDLVFAGVEFATQALNIETMTHFHMDVWVPTGTTFKVKLVDFGEDGAFGGAPDSEHELTFNAGSTPPFATGAWVALEVPLTDFAGLVSRAHLAQLILSGDTRTVYVDNIYFHK